MERFLFSEDYVDKQETSCFFFLSTNAVCVLFFFFFFFALVIASIIKMLSCVVLFDALNILFFPNPLTLSLK